MTIQSFRRGTALSLGAVKRIKSAWVSNHPDWLSPSSVPLTIICGPPCSGKTTFAKAAADQGDIVIDLDDIALGIDASYRPWEKLFTPGLLNESIRRRNEALGALSKARTGKAWFIVSAPTTAEREWWRGKLGGEVKLLDPGANECKRRAIARGTPRAVAGIDDWYRRSRKRWARMEDMPAGSERFRGSRQERGYDGDWSRLRDRYKKHVKGMCEECARRGYLVLGDDVDHIIPIRDEPDLRLDWDNLQMLCWQHHKGWKAKIEDYARKIGAIRMLPQWCKYPETRPIAFKIMRYGPMRGLIDGEDPESQGEPPRR